TLRDPASDSCRFLVAYLDSGNHLVDGGCVEFPFQPLVTSQTIQYRAGRLAYYFPSPVWYLTQCCRALFVVLSLPACALPRTIPSLRAPFIICLWLGW